MTYVEPIIESVRTVTLPSSGHTLPLLYISPILMNDMRKAAQKSAKKQMTKPVPPIMDIDYGNGTVRPEPNEAHPAYLREMQEYNMIEGQRFLELVFKYGVDCVVDVEAVKALRAQAESDDLELPADDKTVYVSRILVQSEADLLALQEAILGRSLPTEEQVSTALERFPANLPGS